MLLIIDQHKKNADSVCEMFYFMGILSCGVTPKDAISEYSPIYKAILVTNPDGIPLIEDFIEKLRGYVGLTPIFSLSSKSEISKYRHLFADSFEVGAYSSHLAQGIIQYALDKGITPIGNYMLAGIDARCDRPEVSYFGKSLELTKTQSMILRTLIAAYPKELTAADILKYSYRQGRLPEPSSIRTHICVINKAFARKYERSLITYQPDRGYTVLTPEKIGNLSAVT